MTAGRLTTVPVRRPNSAGLVPAVLADLPLAYWPMTLSTDVKADASGNSRPLITAGGGTDPVFGSTSPPVRPDPGSLDWTAATDALKVNDAGWNELGNGPWTLECWVNFTDVGTQQGLIEKYDGGTDGGYLLRLLSTGHINASPVTAAIAVDFLAGNTALATKVNYHIAWTYTSGNVGTLYLNGVPDGSKTHSVSGANGNAPVLIGARSGDQAFRFSGRMSHVAIYGTVLSAERIRAHYDAGVGKR